MSIKAGLFVGNSSCGVSDFQRSLSARWIDNGEDVVSVESLWKQSNVDYLVVSLPMLDLRFRLFLAIELWLTNILYKRKTALIVHEYEKVRKLRKLQIYSVILVASKIGYYRGTNILGINKFNSKELSYIGPNLLLNRTNDCVDENVIGFFGHIYRSKLIEEILQFVGERPKYTVKIVGNILDLKYKRELENIIDTNNLSDRVVFYGEMSQNLAEEILSGCNFFIQWSKYPWTERNGSVLALVPMRRPIFVRKSTAFNALRDYDLPVLEILALDEIERYIDCAEEKFKRVDNFDVLLWEKVMEQMKELLDES